MRQYILLIGVVWLTGLISPAAWSLNVNVDPSIPFPNGAVNAMVRVGNRIYVGGAFPQMGGVTRNGLAALDAQTGALIQSWDPGLPASSLVRSLATDGTYLYVGGSFSVTYISPSTPITLHNLVAFKLDDGGPAALVPNWRPEPGGSSSGGPYAMVFKNSFLYAAGIFTSIGNPVTTQTTLAAVEPAGGGRVGAVNTSWNPGCSGAVFCLACDNNNIYAGGAFSQVGNFTRENVVAISLATGSAAAVVDPAWNPKIVHSSATPVVYSMAVSGNWLCVGGSFTDISWTNAQAGQTVTPHARLAALQLANGTNTGSPNPTWNLQIGSLGGSSVKSIMELNDHVIVGGEFPSVTGGQRRGIFEAARPDSGTNTLTAWNPELESTNVLALTYGVVNASAPLGSLGVLVGGAIKKFNGESRTHMAGFSGGGVSQAHAVWMQAE